MRLCWLADNKSRSLIVFCNGWGMDERPFLFLDAGEYDVVMLYDYRDMQIPKQLSTVLEQYQTRHLISWSMGVWGGQQLFADKAGLFDRRIAINGTLSPVDDKYGIPVERYDATLNNYSVENRQRFYRRMCRGQSILKTFLANQPQRGVEDQKEELGSLGQMVKESPPLPEMYETAIVSNNDLVFPAASQLAFWRQTQEPVLIDGCHFPFHRWSRWDEILAETAHYD